MRFKFEFELNRVIDMNSFSSGHTCIYFSFSYFPLALVHCLQIHMSYSHRLRYALLTVYLYTISTNSLHFMLSHSAYSIDSSIHLFFILRPLLSLSLCVYLSHSLSFLLSLSLYLSLCLSLSLSLSLIHSLCLSFSFSFSLFLSLSRSFLSISVYSASVSNSRVPSVNMTHAQIAEAGIVSECRLLVEGTSITDITTSPIFVK